MLLQTRCTRPLPLFTNGASAATTAPATAANSAIAAHLNEMDRGATSGLGLANGTAWTSPLGGRAHQSEIDASSGYDARLYGMIAGADADVSERMRLGMAFAYSQNSLKSVSDVIDNTMHIDSYDATLYGVMDVTKAMRLRAGVGGGWHQFDGTRHLAFASLTRTAEASYDGYSANAAVFLENSFSLGDSMTFTPSVGIRYESSWDNSYLETGASALNLHVGARHDQNLQPSLDGRFDYMLSNGLELTASGGLAYDLLNERSRLSVAYEGASTSSFLVEGPEASALSEHMGVGMLMKLRNGVDLSAAYNLGLGDGLSSHTAGLTAKWAF